MKMKTRILLITFCLFVVFACFNSSYAWSIEKLAISNLVIEEGILKSIDLQFDVPHYLAETTSWVGLQTKQFNHGDENSYGDLTDYGTVYEKNYANSDEVLSDNDFCEEFGTKGFNSEGFPCFGTHYSIKTTISELSVDLSQNQTFYVYLWTLYNERFYPDALIATFEISDGNLVVTDSEGNTAPEIKIIEKIEIENTDLALKVGEKPAYNAYIKDNIYNLKLAQTLISTPDQYSTITSDESEAPYMDSDRLVKDFKYEYIIEIINEDDKNFQFAEDIKIFVDGVEGVEYEDFAFTDQNVIYIYKEDCITPEGYIASTFLDEEFEEKQRSELEKVILQAIKEGNVKFEEENFDDIIKEALENEDEILVDFYVSETLRRSVAKILYDEDVIEKIDDKILEEQELQAYCMVKILVYVNGEVGSILELSTPISVTMPLPDGITQLQEGYERIWKVIRYHDGSAEVIDANQTENGIECLNDKFSEFAMVYEDKKIAEDIEDVPEDEITEKVEINNPKTGDNIILWIELILLSVLGIFVTSKYLIK